MKKLILYLSAIAVSCTCVAAEFFGAVSAEVLLDELFAKLHAPPPDDWEHDLFVPENALVASSPQPLEENYDGGSMNTDSASIGMPSTENSSVDKVIRPPDSVHDNLFFNALHTQLAARNFAFSHVDKTKKKKLLAMFTAYHALPDLVKPDIIEALKSAGINRARRRMGVTPAKLLERQERKKEADASFLRRLKEKRLGAEGSELAKAERLAERNKMLAARSRDNMKLFRSALSQELDQRGVTYSCKRITGVRYGPREEGESSTSYRKRHRRLRGETLRKNKQLELNSMISAFDSLGQQARDEIIAKFQEESIPHVKKLFSLRPPAPDNASESET